MRITSDRISVPEINLQFKLLILPTCAIHLDRYARIATGTRITRVYLFPLFSF